MILNETVAAIAEAIREKTGKSELIKPVDFAEEIKGITAGGGTGESGGNTSNWRYFDYSAVTAAEAKSVLMGLSHLIAMPIGGQVCIFPSIMGSSSAMTKGAICLDVLVVGPFNENNEITQMTYGEFVEFMTTANGIDFASIPEITKEQFYDLNA